MTDTLFHSFVVLAISFGVVLLVVFFGMLALCWRQVTAQHDALKMLAQLLASTPAKPLPPVIDMPAVTSLPAPAPQAPKQVSAPAPSAPVPQAVAAPFATYPKWFQLALHEIGFRETGDNQGIERYIAMAHCGALGDAWCAIFLNAMLESSGVPGSRSASSQSYRTHPDFVQLQGPAPGCIVVFWRTSKSSGLGHVGLYRGEDEKRIWTLGGNESDMVQIEALPKDSATFGLVGYYWPKGVALPTIGAVMMPTGSAVSVQIDPTGAAIAPAVPSPNSTAQFRSLVPGGYFSSTPFDRSIPASIRTNNPGALNVAPWIKSAPGYVGDKVTSMSGDEPNSTVIFSAPEFGVAAWLTLLHKYAAAGVTTLGAIITRYGGGQNYATYAAQVASWSGLGEQTQIDLNDDAMLLPFAKAMFRYEAGELTPLTDAQIVYGFNLARETHAIPAPTVT